MVPNYGEWISRAFGPLFKYRLHHMCVYCNNKLKACDPHYSIFTIFGYAIASSVLLHCTYLKHFLENTCSRITDISSSLEYHFYFSGSSCEYIYASSVINIGRRSVVVGVVGGLNSATRSATWAWIARRTYIKITKVYQLGPKVILHSLTLTRFALEGSFVAKWKVIANKSDACYYLVHSRTSTVLLCSIKMAAYYLQVV